MIVLDASVVVELLTNGALADAIRRDLARRDESFIVPHLIDVEVMSALRRLVAGQRIGPDRSDEFLTGLATLPAERYSHTPLIGRIWELRHNFTAYDAAYIALAEETNATLYTSDEKLCKGHRARVVLFTQEKPPRSTRATRRSKRRAEAQRQGRSHAPRVKVGSRAHDLRKLRKAFSLLP